MNTAATITIPVPDRESQTIPLETLADYLNSSILLEKHDLGTALVYRARHPVAGEIVLVNTSGDANLLLHV